MKLLDMEDMEKISAYQIGDKIFPTKEECRAYVQEHNLQEILRECLSSCISLEFIPPYVLEQFTKQISQKKEELKKWL